MAAGQKNKQKTRKKKKPQTDEEEAADLLPHLIRKVLRVLPDGELVGISKGGPLPVQKITKTSLQNDQSDVIDANNHFYNLQICKHICS